MAQDGKAAASKSGADKAFSLQTLMMGLALFATLVTLRAIVVDGLGDTLASKRPDLALQLGRRSPEVLSAVAEEKLRAGDLRGAAALSTDALRQSPLYVPALRIRGLLLEKAKQPQQARAVFDFAGARSWRDNEVQAWLLRENLRARNFAEALRHADALLRRRLEFQTPIFNLFAVATVDADASKALVARLAERPLWRTDFLTVLAQSRQTDAPVARLFQMVDESRAPLSIAELSAYTRRLAREGRYLDAFQGLRQFKASRTLMAAIPYDGEFDRRPGVAPFDWTVAGTTGVSVDYDAAPGRLGDQAARVDYDGFTDTPILGQVIALAPGNYRLNGESYQQEGPAGQLLWQIRCLGDSKLLLSTAPDATKAGVWRSFGGDFTVPASGCDGLRLVLIGAPKERRNQITTWFDKLRISPAKPGGGR